MAAPNIDIIAASLRSCSLARGAVSSPEPPPFRPIGVDLPSEGSTGGAVVEAADTTLELNSEVALPYHWEQCLDLKTGKIYYINWSTGAKSMEDPRKFAGFRDRYYSDEDEEEEDGDDADDENDGVEDDDDGGDSSEDSATTDSDDNGNCSSAFSSSSSASSRDTIERGCGAGGWRGGVAAGGSVLVAAGCRVCMMYVMIPKREEECPRCGGHVLHFSRSGDR
ncbi:unnamed protein product [Spirodela intermedia]|uniref:WW domain-containing protein n=1 Tax=Spirodela intermedia TaxID=51605 RepID=A0A7I8KGB7_SPIIN|nr:unnamed protein product [Spirodela intermedia]